MAQVPMGIGGMSALETFDLESNVSGATQPLDLSEIGTLAKLEKLKLRVNVPLHFPASMAGMLSLKEIDMQESMQQVLPDGIADLPAIHSLKANKNRIEVLPDWIGNMKSLTYLHLDSNQIKRLPESLALATSLTHLGLYNNQFTEFPEVILRSPSLQDVGLGHNKISAIALPQGQSTSLRSLSISENHLKAFPWDLAALPNLRFYVSGNPFFKPGTQGMGQVIYRVSGTPYSPGTRRALLSLAIGDIPKAMETATLEDLLIALGDEEPKMRAYAMEALQGFLTDPFSEGQTVTSIRIAGQSKMYSIPEFKKQLEAKGIKVNKGKPGTVQVMVLAEKPGEDVMAFIQAGAKPATIVHLAAFIGKPEEKWLQKQSTEQPKLAENIGKLLGSGNGESIQIALRMMVDGGVPEGFHSPLLAIHLIHPDSKVRKPAGELFISIASPQLNAFLQAKKRNAVAMSTEKLLKHLGDLSSHAEIDKPSFARQAFAINKELGPFFAPYAKAEDLPNFLDSNGYVSLPTAKKISEIPAALRDANHVDSLSFASNDWKTLPEGIGKIKGLRRLILRSNKLKDLPEEFRLLQDLEFLDLAFNDFAVFPAQVCDLQKLSALDMRRNPFKELPQAFAKLTSLKVFRCSEHQMTVFPEILEQMTQLETLDLWSMRGVSAWKEFPEGILKLTRLRTLEFGGHQITTLPEGLGNLPLEHLELASNQLTALPESLSKIKTLRHLGLSLNRGLAQLPSGIGALENLESLEIGDTAITTLPASFKQLQRLQELDITKLTFQDPDAFFEIMRQLPALQKIRYPFPPDKAFKADMVRLLPQVKVV